MSDKAGSKESKIGALATSENRLSDLTVSCKTSASFLDKLTTVAAKLLQIESFKVGSL